MPPLKKTVLNDYQRQLVEDNLAYCYYWFNQHQVYNEDHQQTLLYYVCRYIHLYDPERGAITTFITAILKSRNIRLYNLENSRKRIFDSLAISMDDTVIDIDGSSDPLTWHDIIGNPDYNFNNIEDNEIFNDFMNRLEKSTKLTKNQYKIFIAYLTTGSQVEVARMYGISRQAVHTTVKRVRDIIKMKKYLKI